MPESFSRLFFPQRCVHCDSDYGDDGSGGICSGCEPELQFFGGNLCAKCGWEFSARAAPLDSIDRVCRRCRATAPPFRRLRSLGWYSGALGSMIKSAKFAENRLVFERLIPAAESLLGGEAYDSIVSIPSDHDLNREFVSALASRIGAQVDDPLIRRDGAARQVGLSRKNRRANALTAFTRRDGILSGRILLFDDIVTTGASVAACARILRDAGANQVDALSLGRAVSGGHNAMRTPETVFTYNVIA